MKSIATALLALVLSCAAARAQEEEAPADLLSHVKIGQRYTFSTTVGEMVNEEVWHVAAVLRGQVCYLRTTRVKQGARTLVEQVDQELSDWRWGGRPTLEPAALALSKGTQRRETLEVSGLRLDCVVTLMSGTEAWTAVKGDLETFPAIVKASAQGVAVRALVRVEEGPPPTLVERAPTEEVEEGSGLPKGALDHVKVGQRWVFVQEMESVRVELAWTVTAVHAAEGRVLYTVKSKTVVGTMTTESEEEEPQEWSAGGSPVMDAGTTVTGITHRREVLDVGGLKLDCYVVRTDMEGVTSEVWTAVRGDREVFPGPVKTVLTGQGGLRLVRVEQ